MYIAKIESRVAGIPCIIGVMNYTKVRGSFSRNAASDMDYYGYCESEWEVCDRRGRPAPWLERKLNQSERDRIEQTIIDYFLQQHIPIRKLTSLCWWWIQL